MTDTAAQPDSVIDPDVWDHLARHRDRKQRCLDDVLKIQDACPKDPGHAKTPVADCKTCHRKIIDRISHRYLDSPETEWYADRRTFLQHLAELFPAVRRGEVDASGIEDRVMDEKRKWHRENVRRIALAMAGFGMPERKEELLRLVDDRKMKFSDFCARVREVIARGMTDHSPEAMERLISTRNDPKARVEAYKEIFFFPHGERDEVVESTRKYLEMIEQGLSMNKVAGRMVEDRRQGIADRAELEKLQNRIEYLKKAKATWLVQRKRGQRDEEKKPKVPPCFRCGLPQEVADPPSCSICQVAVAHGIMEEAVVYCSEECQRLAHGQHVAKAHKCAAGEHCITLYQPEEDGEGFTDQTNGQGDAYLCEECLEQRKTVAVFCTLACAESNFNHHREDGHPPTPRSRSVGPPDTARLHDNHGARSEAHGWEDVKARLVTLEQALQDMQEKKVIDELKFVPKLRPAVEPSKTQPADNSDAHMGIEKGGDLPPKPEVHAAITPPDEMDMDGANEREIDCAPASPAGAPLIRHSDGQPVDHQMEGVETQLAPHPTADHNADTEMMDAVEVADFATQPEPAETKPAPAAEEPAPEEPVPEESAREPAAMEPASEAAAKPEPAAPKEAASSTTESKAKPASEASDGKLASQPSKDTTTDSDNPADTIPLADPGAKEEVKKPNTTIAASDKITSIEPMPSLGRTLEVEIAGIPADREVEPDEPEREPPGEEVLARIRNAEVKAMDKIADEKATAIHYGLIGLAASGDGGKSETGREEGVRRAMSAAVEAVAETAGAKKVVDQAVADAEIERPSTDAGGEPGDKTGNGETGDREAGADKAPSAKEATGGDKPGADKKAEDQQPTASQQPKIEATSSDKPAERTDKEGVAKAPSADVSQKSADSMEEGEISDHSSRKRKASVEPGEVEEDSRQGKKARSVDAADGSERTGLP
ncbi:hypothetical protein BR93DRAFT_958076 [Coniochaeta sp. PMI_546]|nr:hypothetical protein BR93DRAFT_958076 [Coniochaeta sp. PMI_546]